MNNFFFYKRLYRKLDLPIVKNNISSFSFNTVKEIVIQKIDLSIHCFIKFDQNSNDVCAKFSTNYRSNVFECVV